MQTLKSPGCRCQNPNRKRDSLSVPRWISCLNCSNPLQSGKKKSLKFGLCLGRRRRLKLRTGCLFCLILRSCSPTQQCMRLSTQSPKVGVEESAPRAAAPSGVQLQPLINWMLRFQTGNPRETHHLRRKGSPMKTSASPAEGARTLTHSLCHSASSS